MNTEKESLLLLGIRRLLLWLSGPADIRRFYLGLLWLTCLSWTIRWVVIG